MVNPTDEVLTNYRHLIETRRELAEKEVEVADETRTRDGTRITLLSNINLLSDLEAAERFKAEGVGLYRSEFPFLVRADFPSEEEQFRIYSRICEKSGEKEVTFRTLDVGGDKILPYHQQEDEEMNPFLGMRGIRFSLRYPIIFCQQLRALLRAGHGRVLNIMFPMVTSLDDFLDAKGIVNECIYELQQEGVPHNSQPNLGVMIEVPSAVEVVNELAEEVQFLSIGTNDLIQYMLAVDRTNQNVADLYINFHPAVLRAMNKVADAAIRNDITLSICGKMATDPHMLAFLLGIGIKKLSVAPRSIPQVQNTIKELHIEDAHFAARKMLGYGEISEIVEFLKTHVTG